MVVVNLLPWRDREHAYHKRTLLRCFGLVLSMSILLVFVIYSNTERSKHIALQRIKKLKMDIAQFSEKKSLALSSIPVFSRDRAWHLVHYHTDGLRIFAELGKKPGEHVCWTTIERKKNGVLFVGRTDSAFDLTELLRSWNAAPLFSQIKLESLSKQPMAGWEFKLMALPRTMLSDSHLEREDVDD